MNRSGAGLVSGPVFCFPMLIDRRPVLSARHTRIRSLRGGAALTTLLAAALLFGRTALPAAETAGAPAATSPRLLLLDAARVGEDVVTVGESGTVLRSSDSGRTWTAVATGEPATLTGVAFAPNSSRGWAVGHDALILVTNDHGRSWQKQWQGPDLEASFLDVCALSADRAIAVGAYGLFMVTADGGRSWQAQRVLEEDMHLNRVTQGSEGVLYLAGERGTLLRSENQGESWEPIDSPYDGSFYGVLPLGDGQLVAHGLRGRVFRSSDGGDAWQNVPLPQPVLIATAVQLRNGTIVLAGQARAHFVSTNRGESFADWPILLDTAVAELLEAPDGALLAFGEAGATRLDAP